MWLETLNTLQERGEACITVPVAQVRGHAPRGAGSKMLVTEAEVYGSVGGGNLERSAVERARRMLSNQAVQPELFTVTLTPQGGDWGVQCCGGEVTLLLEPLRPHRPTVALFGAGHVGWALVKVLSTLPIEIHLIDSRADQLEIDYPKKIYEANLVLSHKPVADPRLNVIPVAATTLDGVDSHGDMHEPITAFHLDRLILLKSDHNTARQIIRQRNLHPQTLSDVKIEFVEGKYAAGNLKLVEGIVKTRVVNLHAQLC